MTDNNVPPSFDEDADDEVDLPLSEYDALPDEPEPLTENSEFEGINITEREGPDLEGGDDLDTGAGGGQRKRYLVLPL